MRRVCAPPSSHKHEAKALYDISSWEESVVRGLLFLKAPPLNAAWPVG